MKRECFRLLVCGLLIGMLSSGCESLQRKFTRKPKHPVAAPSPIINFQDYTRALTPLDRYRKHYLMFDYWNHDLLDGLRATPLNPKRLKRASKESTAELKILQEMLTEEKFRNMTAILEEREGVDRQIQGGRIVASQVSTLLRSLESQTRQIQREFFWRDVEDALKPYILEAPPPQPAPES